MSAVLIALIVAFPSGVVPLFLAHMGHKQRLAEKAQDWARQDELASRLDTANGTLGKIHRLVNSAMTAQMQTELEGLKRELVMMRKVLDLNRSAGYEPTTEDLASIEATETRMEQLDAELRERLELETVLSKENGGDL